MIQHKFVLTLGYDMLYNSNVRKERAVVAQSVERFLGKEEVRQFKSAQQLQRDR